MADSSPAASHNIARDIVVALVSTGKIMMFADPNEQGEWLGGVYKAVQNAIRETK
jgi:hypothetical protein